VKLMNAEGNQAIMVNSAVILAGGKSSRFGKPKGLILIDGKPLIERLIEEIKLSGIEHIYISAEDSELYEIFGCPVIKDRFRECGPLAGIHAALEEIDDDGILVLSCDLPRITANEIGLIVEEARGSPVQVVFAGTINGPHPLCSVVKREILDSLADTLSKGKYGVLDFFSNLEYIEVFCPNDDAFLNVNTPGDLENDESDYSDEHLYEELPVTRYISKTGAKEISDPVIREAIIRIWLNDDEVAEIQALPKEVEELALGFLYSECIINDPSKVNSIEFNEKLLAVTVCTSERIEQFRSGIVRNVAPGCGQVLFSVAPSFIGRFEPIKSDFQVLAEDIPILIRQLTHLSHLFRLTGGVHTAGLSDGVNLLHVTDDIGRHNCIDKIIGLILRNPIVSPERRMILTSGRISTDIVLKAVRAGFPFVVSHSAASSGSIHLAEKYGITLIGFARGARFNIYTHKERVII